jgi:RNA polymerase sigma factor (sigma-70 family)
MPEAPVTRLSLLLRLRDFQDHDAWAQFVGVYAPLIYDFVRRRGLQDADAADLTQVCLRQVASHVGSLEYDPRRGTFRGWLFTIVVNALRDFHARAQNRCQATGDSEVRRLLESQPAQEEDDAEEWAREHRRSLFAWAAQQVCPHVEEATWQAFWKTAVENQPSKDVARQLGLTVAGVYLAKSRIMARLRALIRDIQEEE